MLASHSRVPFQVQAALLPIHLPSNAPVKAGDAGPSIWIPVSDVGEPDMLCDSWL